MRWREHANAHTKAVLEMNAQRQPLVLCRKYSVEMIVFFYLYTRERAEKKASLGFHAGSTKTVETTMHSSKCIRSICSHLCACVNGSVRVCVCCANPDCLEHSYASAVYVVQGAGGKIVDRIVLISIFLLNLWARKGGKRDLHMEFNTPLCYIYTMYNERNKPGHTKAHNVIGAK